MRVKWTYSRLEDKKKKKSVENSWALIDYQEPRNFFLLFYIKLLIDKSSFVSSFLDKSSIASLSTIGTKS